MGFLKFIPFSLTFRKYRNVIIYNLLTIQLLMIGANYRTGFNWEGVSENPPQNKKKLSAG